METEKTGGQNSDYNINMELEDMLITGVIIYLVPCYEYDYVCFNCSIRSGLESSTD